MKTLTLLLVLAAALILAACKSEEAVPITSGIEGQVLIGPMCPVVQEGTPCPDQPYQATIVVRTADQSEEVTTFTTDPEGRFRVGLPPGEYYIDPQPPESGGPPTPIPQTVTVPEDAFVQVTIEYDSGIR
jgi:hypothetical protein